MRLYQIDPIQDPRWQAFVEKHPRGSVFHTARWLTTLQRTYRYKPVVFTTSPFSSELQNGLVFCYVRSWLTGRRMVSLPFSDHCEPLFDSEQELDFVANYLQANVQHRDWKYIELRPLSCHVRQGGSDTGFQPAQEYCLHRMNLRPSLEQLFRGLHKDSAQRRIRRAERAGLVYERGRSLRLLNAFYGLLVLTRSRHRIPPQPFAWFRNLVECMKDQLEIRLAYLGEVPIAATLTLRFRDTVYYKYSCSDARFKNLGAIALLLWKTIEESKGTGAEEFDLGRSETDNKALIAFKSRWTQDTVPLVYLRFPSAPAPGIRRNWKRTAAKRVFAYCPDWLLPATGRLIYPHIG